jgi:hypothetical protein
MYEFLAGEDLKNLVLTCIIQMIWRQVLSIQALCTQFFAMMMDPIFIPV